MSDPLSIAAGVVGVTTAVLQISKLLYNDIKNIANAPDTVKFLANDIAALNDSLVSIEAIQPPQWEKLGVGVADQTKAVLGDCEKACSTFRDDLAGWTQHSRDGTLSKRDRLTLGIYKDKEILSVSRQLQSWKLSLTGTISLATLHSSLRTVSTTDNISGMIISYREDTVAASTKLQGQVEAIGTTLKDLTLAGRPITDTSANDDLLAAIALLKEERAAIQASQALLQELVQKLQSEATLKSMTQQNRCGTPDPIGTPSPPRAIPFFPPDPDFVPRASLIASIDKKLSNPAARAALVGLGGVGKSQAAIEYARQLRERSPRTWVLWIHASNVARFELSVRDLLEQLDIPSQEKLEDMLRIFRSWLRDAKKGKWLVILDNADDPRFLLEPPGTNEEGTSQKSRAAERCIDYLPVCNHGTVLFTTRSRAAALDLVDDNNIIGVAPMDERQAVTLLENRLKSQSSREALPILASALDYMPLALTQAAAYIKQRAPRCSVEQYIQKLQRNDKSTLKLLEFVAKDHQRDREATNSIIRTWQISFEHIYAARPSAADLLSLMSFFDRQSIPAALLQERGSSPVAVDKADKLDLERDGVEDVVHNEDSYGHSYGHSSGNSSGNSSNNVENDLDTAAEELEEDIIMLRDYSFISSTTDADTFEMHRLVQLATQSWLAANKSQERWMSQFIVNLEKSFPSGEYGTWAACKTLYPHVKVALELKPEGREEKLRKAGLMYRSAFYALRNGALADAESMAVQSMQSLQEELGPAQLSTLWSAALLARVWGDRGQWTRAEVLIMQVIETMKRVLGEEHLDTLTCISYLARTFCNQGRWTEADELQVQVLETQKRVLGEEHLDTLTSISNLAQMFYEQGRWKEAEELLVHVLEWRKRVLGEEHLYTLTSISNLAVAFHKQGRWKEAEELQVQVLETEKRVLGEEHPDTLITMANLSHILQVLGRRQSSVDLMTDCVARSNKILGADHPHTVRRCEDLEAWEAELKQT